MSRRPVAYEQVVTIRVPVVVTGREGDFDTLSNDDVAEWAMEHVRSRLPVALRGSQITPSRGPSGSRYYWPEEIAEGRGPGDGGLRVPVGKVLA